VDEKLTSRTEWFIKPRHRKPGMFKYIDTRTGKIWSSRKMKLCLIGSSRFLEKYNEINRKLSLAGHVVYSIATVSTSVGSGPPLTADEKDTLDLVHLLKIQESDACFLITDETKYVGDSTKREMKWAVMQDMAVLSDGDLEYLCDNITEGMPNLEAK
jgi:hypothetical protein